jgi:hypothetical protein
MPRSPFAYTAPPARAELLLRLQLLITRRPGVDEVPAGVARDEAIGGGLGLGGGGFGLGGGKGGLGLLEDDDSPNVDERSSCIKMPPPSRVALLDAICDPIIVTSYRPSR